MPKQCANCRHKVPVIDYSDEPDGSVTLHLDDEQEFACGCAASEWHNAYVDPLNDDEDCEHAAPVPRVA